MKKITLLFLLFTVSMSFGQVMLSEDFESGLTLPTGWTNNEIAVGGGLWEFATGGNAPNFTLGNTFLYDPAMLSGNYAIFNSDALGNDEILENTALESPAFDCSGLTVVKVSFNHFIYTPFGGEGHVEVYNGTSWVEVAVYDESDDPVNGYVYGQAILDVSSELAGVSNAQVRFRWVGDYSYWWAVDNVVVQQPTVSAPDVATAPSPANNATDVPLVQDDVANYPNKIYFSWTDATTGDPATSTSLVLGTENPPTQTFNNFENGDFIYNISYDTTYYWQVISENIGGTTASEIWNFTTQADPTMSVDENSSVLFSVYPNPVTDRVKIKTQLQFDTLEIVNQLGQSVLKVNANSLIDHTLDLNSLKSGVYFIKVNTENKTQTVKIVKQ